MPARLPHLRFAVTSTLLVVLAACSAAPAPSPQPTTAPTAPGSTPPPSAGTPEPTSQPTLAPSASAAPSDEPAPTPIRVTLETAAGGPTHIDIVDWTGTLSGATSGTPGDGASVAPGTLELANDIETSLRLTWSAAPCATGDTLVLEPGLTRITLLSPPCDGDALPLDRVLVLHFSGPVAADGIDAVVQTALDTPA